MGERLVQLQPDHGALGGGAPADPRDLSRHWGGSGEQLRDLEPARACEPCCRCLRERIYQLVSSLSDLLLLVMY